MDVVSGLDLAPDKGETYIPFNAKQRKQISRYPFHLLTRLDERWRGRK